MDAKHYLSSILGNLLELQRLSRRRVRSGEVSLLGLQALADNVEWLESYIEKETK